LKARSGVDTAICDLAIANLNPDLGAIGKRLGRPEMKRLFSLPYHLRSPWPDLFRPPTSFATYSAEHKKSWMAGTSPAKGHRSQGSRKHRGVEVVAATLSWPSAEEDSASHINLDKALDILLGDALA
jgi:hypothetical protein